MEHHVKLMPAEFVKAFDIRNKNDAADARAVCLAVQQASKASGEDGSAAGGSGAAPGAAAAGEVRTMQINCLRGLLTAARNLAVAFEHYNEQHPRISAARQQANWRRRRLRRD